MRVLSLLLWMSVGLSTANAEGNAYYVSSSDGKDNNDGL